MPEAIDLIAQCSDWFFWNAENLPTCITIVSLCMSARTSCPTCLPLQTPIHGILSRWCWFSSSHLPCHFLFTHAKLYMTYNYCVRSQFHFFRLVSFHSKISRRAKADYQHTLHKLITASAPGWKRLQSRYPFSEQANQLTNDAHGKTNRAWAEGTWETRWDTTHCRLREFIHIPSNILFVKPL